MATWPYLGDFSGWEWVRESLGFLGQPVRILRAYPRAQIRTDLIAGLSIAAVLLPQSIAYALLAELPPQYGLYTAICAAIVGALWGSSPYLHSGPTNTLSLLVLSALIPLVEPGSPQFLTAAGLMAVMVGVAQLAMGVARLGVLVNFVSDSVIVGFTAGAGVLIAANQLRHLFGIPLPSAPEFYVTIWELIRHLVQTHWPSLFLGLGTILVVSLLKLKRPRWPAALIGLVGASLLVAFLHLERLGVAVLGEIPRTLPKIAPLPLFNLTLIGKLSTGSLAVALIGLIQTLSIARTFAVQTGQNLDSNQEFIGQGVTNLVAGFLSGYASSGSFMLSAVKHDNRGRTHISSVFSGVWVLVAVLLFAPWAVYLPKAALAGVLIVTSYGMVDRKEMKRIWRSSLGDSAIMVTTLLATMFLPLEFAVLAGVMISFVRFIVKTSMPAVYSVVPSEDYRHLVPNVGQTACPQLAVMTISGPLYFGATNHIETTVRHAFATHPEEKLLLLRLHLIDHCDVSGIHMLESIVQHYRKNHGDVFIAGARANLMERIRLSGFYQWLGEDHFLARDEAIGHLFYHVLDPAICVYQCPYRIFAECQALPKYEYASPLPSMMFLEHEVQSWQPSELKWFMEQEGLIPKLHIVDVREPPEFEQGHISDANLIPMRLIPYQLQHLSKDDAIVLVCRSGRRSRLAAGILQDRGFTHVFNLEGGMLAWEAAGFPMVKVWESG